MDNNILIRDEYTTGYNKGQIIAGLNKLTSLFSEILETHDKTFEPTRVIVLMFYLCVYSELDNGKLIVDCPAFIAGHNKKTPTPSMREIRALPRFGFVLDELGLKESHKGDGRMRDILSFKVSHTNPDIIPALKVFSDVCGLPQRDVFRNLDFGILNADPNEKYISPESAKKPESAISDILSQDRFNPMSEADKQFIIDFDDAMKSIGYSFGGDITWGACWGKYQVIWSKVGVKTKQVTARVYIREDQIVLRLYFSKIDKHRSYIENAEDYIKQAFTKGYGDCGHCGNEKDGVCNYRKSYTIDDQLIDKCNGYVFEFYNPNHEKLSGYVNIMKEFYSKGVQK
jgi:hypothetical protein